MVNHFAVVQVVIAEILVVRVSKGFDFVGEVVVRQVFLIQLSIALQLFLGLFRSLRRLVEEGVGRAFSRRERLALVKTEVHSTGRWRVLYAGIALGIERALLL
ncbi:hypothetical protein D3C80_1842020 [compost metagenome]